ncbi:hypothetical protein OCK74_09340 [Chitinophagaceae bacterium LB-8]|jgi:hypothetical protein|uniref:Uncharacterized protein n=1 Tax=Paraflavisolibacter caeni TaxID=2982496 RepID=A0A9X2XX47_9BACT|nr:hypothetical protein [Paraflavisolibacter caeni]MCU7549318.1 hypothetical protein [Paraflavisolibacter caeni]
MNEHDLVTIDPSILEDPSTKSNHHLFKRIIAQKERGTIQHLDIEKSKELKAKLYWVKFYVAAIRIDEK